MDSFAENTPDLRINNDILFVLLSCIVRTKMEGCRGAQVWNLKRTKRSCLFFQTNGCLIFWTITEISVVKTQFLSFRRVRRGEIS
jgi:hypothetical protein